LPKVQFLHKNNNIFDSFHHNINHMLRSSLLAPAGLWARGFPCAKASLRPVYFDVFLEFNSINFIIFLLFLPVKVIPRLSYSADDIHFCHTMLCIVQPMLACGVFHPSICHIRVYILKLFHHVVAPPLYSFCTKRYGVISTGTPWMRALNACWVWKIAIIY